MTPTEKDVHDIRDLLLRREGKGSYQNEADWAFAIVMMTLLAIVFGLVLFAKPLFHYLANH